VLKLKKENKHAFFWKREKIKRKKKKLSVTNRSSSAVTCHIGGKGSSSTPKDTVKGHV